MTLPFMPPIQPGNPVKPAHSALTGLLPFPVSASATEAAIEAENERVRQQLMAQFGNAQAVKPAKRVSQKEQEKLYPYVTQHCANGAHENATVFSERGERFSNCRGEYKYRFVTITCTCWCHAMFASVRAEGSIALASVDTDMHPAVTAVSGDSRTQETTPRDTPPTTPPLPDGAKNGHLAEHPVYRNAISGSEIDAKLIRLMYRNVFDTDAPEREVILGRMKRGSLEAHVELVCRMWQDGFITIGDELTIYWICLLINPEDEPSPGAVHAVLTRWAEHGLCKIEHKPMRFVSFTDGVNDVGVAEMVRLRKREAIGRAKGFF